jgi:hypothetical protein
VNNSRIKTFECSERGVVGVGKATVVCVCARERESECGTVCVCGGEVSRELTACPISSCTTSAVTRNPKVRRLQHQRLGEHRTRWLASNTLVWFIQDCNFA